MKPAAVKTETWNSHYLRLAAFSVAFVAAALWAWPVAA